MRSATRHLDPWHDARRRRRQQLVGLLALPLSLLPFVAYFANTAEGQVLWARTRLQFSEPQLPTLSPADAAYVERAVPDYEGAAAVLVYHGVGSAPDGESEQTMSPERFGEHLATLRAAGMQPITVTDLARARAQGRPLPPRAVLITFDDGRAEAMLWADPLLEQAGMRATMFVITSAASEPGVYYASWSELRAYARSGRWDLQSHTDDHHRMLETAAGSLPALTSRRDGETLAEYEARVEEDLRVASDELFEATGTRPIAFAYPFGAHGTERTNDPDIRDALRRALRASGIELAFHQDEQASVPLVGCQRRGFNLRRLDVGDWTPRQLADRLAQVVGDTHPSTSCVRG
ncbi:MAG TPA: polysaccharide deacetylase family protein [Acidimicrobiia bacterium]|nr:polysaccharide deacetylase family protein [Acidimicrobiia bacterium]